MSAERYARHVNAGTVEQHAERVGDLVAAGAGTVIVSLADLDGPEAVERFADVIAHLRGHPFGTEVGKPEERESEAVELEGGWNRTAGSLTTLMSMPFFSPGDDPGSSFPNLLHRVGITPFASSVPEGELNVPHATTCVAVRYADGVVIAGDRRATSGNLISNRRMEKVAQADRHSAVAIAGAAGPAMEMVKLFQLQLEHYEKVEGQALSLDGKANQLSGLVRSNLPAAMQGMVVVPIFAGYDLRRRQGRLFTYDATGGRYEETELAATGSGSLHAGTVIKVGYRSTMDRDQALDLVLRALWEAADADSATGGPDALRGIYPRRGDRHRRRASPASATTSCASATRAIAAEVSSR